MRPVFPLMFAAVLFGCAKEQPPAPQVLPPKPFVEEVVPDAKYCARPAEKTALEIAGLKTRLMVAALSCGREDGYNAFITGNRSTLVAQEKALSGYFSRNYGRRGQAEHDDYITALANMQSQRRIFDTATFCEQAKELFSAVGAVKTPAELPPVASARKISQPMNLTDCPAEPAKPARATGRAPARR